MPSNGSDSSQQEMQNLVFGPEPLPWGFKVPSWIQGQVNFATVEWSGDLKGEASVKVQKQKIWFQGTKYELKVGYFMPWL